MIHIHDLGINVPLGGKEVRIDISSTLRSFVLSKLTAFLGKWNDGGKFGEGVGGGELSC